MAQSSCAEDHSYGFMKRLVESAHRESRATEVDSVDEVWSFMSISADQHTGRPSIEWPHLVHRKLSRMTLYGMCWIPFIVRRESALKVEGLFSVKIMYGTLLASHHHVN